MKRFGILVGKQGANLKVLSGPTEDMDQVLGDYETLVQSTGIKGRQQLDEAFVLTNDRGLIRQRNFAKWRVGPKTMDLAVA